MRRGAMKFVNDMCRKIKDVDAIVDNILLK